MTNRERMCRLKFKQREREIDFESFLRAKKPWSAFRARARAQTNAHVHFRERERAENENQKSFSTSERLRDLALSLDKVVDV